METDDADAVDPRTGGTGRLCFAVRTRVPDHGFAGAPVEWHDCLFYAAADMLVITRTIFSPLDSILAALAVIALACTLLMRSRHD